MDEFDHESARGDVGYWLRADVTGPWEVSYKQRHRWVWELHFHRDDIPGLVYGKIEADGGAAQPILAIGSFGHAIAKADRILSRLNAD